MAEVECAEVANPPDVPLYAAGAPDEPDNDPSPSPSDEEARCDADLPGIEQSAVAALLGLHAAVPSCSDEDPPSDEGQTPVTVTDAAEHLWDSVPANGSMEGYRSPAEYGSPKVFRHQFEYDTPGYPSPKRMRAPKDGAPPPGTSRFRCKYPGCRKLYASTDAVRKHCRKRHLEWLRQIDRYSTHERGTPKPALYCVWGDEDTEDM